MKKETQADVKVSSGKQSTPAPKVSSGHQGFDQFVRQALHTSSNPNNNGSGETNRTKGSNS
jgi:hypothetical protein